VTDHELSLAFTTLEPTARQRQRIHARVFERLDARDTPLAVEWFRLFRISPLAATGLVAMSTASLATAAPVLWLARALW
jgi:hypothetical protein